MNPASRIPATSLRALRLVGQIQRRSLHQTAVFSAQDESAPDAIDTGAPVKGRTGGGKSLDSSHNAPPKPKISNQSVPGTAKQQDLSEEQKREVDQHNKEFEEKHDRGNSAADDKVDKKFWTG
jgi:hypothetical protein